MKIESYSPTIRRREMDAVLTTLVAEKIGPGEQSARLIQIAKEYLQFEYSLALRSPAIALHVALEALHLDDGSGIVVSALAPAYYDRVISELRLVALYADVEDNTSNVSVETLRAAIERGKNNDGAKIGRCIVINHSLGYVPDLPSLLEIGLPIIEDCSMSFGTNWQDKKAGSFGLFTILGMEERDLITAGGGALLFAHGRRDATVLREYSNLPAEYKLADMNAAMAISQFKESERNYQKRREIAQVYTQSALRTRHKRFITAGDSEYNNYTFPLILETGMKDVVSYSEKKEVAVELAFDQTVMGKGLVETANYPSANSLALRTAVFPLYPRLSSTQIAKVAKVIATLP